MPAMTIGFGGALILLGVIAYFGSGRASVTALIPAFFGAGILLCGVLALRRPRPWTIAAMIVGILGFVGSLSRIAPGLVSGKDFQWNLATGTQAAMAAITAAFVVVCVMALMKGRGATP